MEDLICSVKAIVTLESGKKQRIEFYQAKSSALRNIDDWNHLLNKKEVPEFIKLWRIGNENIVEIDRFELTQEYNVNDLNE